MKYAYAYKIDEKSAQVYTFKLKSKSSFVKSLTSAEKAVSGL